MKHIAAKTTCGRTEVHFSAPNNSFADTLCGKMYGTVIGSTAEKVNCPSCARIVSACKEVKRKEYFKHHDVGPCPRG